MVHKGLEVLREAKEWLMANIAKLAKKTVGYVCNRLNEKLVLKAVLLLERYGKQIEYIDPVSKLLEALDEVEQRLARTA